MSSRTEPSPDSEDPRAPVARLADALAAAQAVARESLQVTGSDTADEAGSGRPDATGSGGPGASESDPGVDEDAGSDPSGVVTRTVPDREPASADNGGARWRDGPEDPAPTSVAGAEDHPGGSSPTASERERRLWPLYAVMAVLVLAVPVLAGVGYHLASESTAGEVLHGSARPEAPGYTALVEPTPTALVIQVSSTGQARTLTLLSLSGPNNRGGAVVSLPVNTRLDIPRHGIRLLSRLVTEEPAAESSAIVASAIGIGFSDVIRVTADELTRFVEPVAPLEIDNPEDVTTPGGQTIAKGRHELTAEQIPEYLAATDSDDSVDGHLQRQGLVWKAWLAKIEAAPRATSAVPGETSAGLGRYLTGLAGGHVDEAALPTIPGPQDQDRPSVKIDRKLSQLLIANAVPFPVAASPGGRATVALLNGTGPHSAPPSVLQRLVFAGAQITTVGNAPHFGVTRTTITYSEPKVAFFASRMADELGVGRVVHHPGGETNPDITIVLGTDLTAHPPAALTTGNLGR